MCVLPRHFQVFLDLDGRPCCRCDSVDMSMGLARSITVDGPIGPHNERIKHSIGFEAEPINLFLNAGMGTEMAKWVSTTLTRKHVRRSGMITVLDAKNGQSGLEFIGAIITEITIPAVDSSAAGNSQLKIKIQPERVKKQPGGIDPRNAIRYGPAFSPAWNSGKFKLAIDGLEHECSSVKTIDSFFIKQGLKKFYVGGERLPTIEPTKIDGSHLILTLPKATAAGFKEWFEKTATPRTPAGRNGSLGYFPAGSASPLLKFEFFGLDPVSASVDSTGALIRLELFIERVTAASM